MYFMSAIQYSAQFTLLHTDADTTYSGQRGSRIDTLLIQGKEDPGLILIKPPMNGDQHLI
ncbi:unnamed protein product [Prunus armeniaca]|uniref:Uncharacterized protein n=1 Tax=Prunus armeniaca TaxID=36596 RepID=A0A6J5TFA1_PRUAR|nr:unnamed protein product [Prunus armeniaca]